ncbi:phage tail sheath C-terminal domain-containing protein [Nocardia jinanensis]|uniref:Tail sheath protein C-terminal domain-containing protein n=1 Tax=Nocardia jinanensis TaxID=382504 RepID=A0A917RMG9_9NOCA|nr:phage tail sheath C-terminal domain-containing protein [Nocardia jinanensis]GGL14705.1 hypothetical protein GCM10011588_31540 [Nocardia jinanensis]
MALFAAAGARPPGVLVQVADPPPPVEPVRIDVPAFVCVCERGPVDQPVRLGSWAQFRLVFGGFIANGFGAYAVKAFFEQGGRVCWVIRVVAPEVTTTAQAPQPDDRTWTRVASVAGFVVGAAATVRQQDTAHTYLVTAVDPTASTLTWDRPLHPSFVRTKPMTVSTGAGFAAARLRAAGGAPALDVVAASPGSWGNALEVVASPGRRTVTVSRAGEPGSSRATPVVSTAGFAVGDVVWVGQGAGSVVSETRIVQRIDPADRIVCWTSPLPAALDLTAPIILETERTSLTVLEHGRVVEIWPDLSMRPEHPRFAPAVVAGSTRVQVRAPGLTAARPVRTSLRGGRDGTAALTVADLVGDEILGDGRGAAALLGFEEPAVLAVPDLVGTRTPPALFAPPPPADPCDPCAEPISVPPPLDAVAVDAGAAFDAEQVVAAQCALVESCERNTERIALLDPPTADSPAELGALRAWAARFSSSYAVAVVPWPTVLDPRTAGQIRRIPACGHLAGMIARTDALSGPWLGPANRTLAWAHGVDLSFTDEQHALANHDGMLVLRALPGRGLVPMGGRTLSVDTSWTFLTVRRTMIYLRRALRVHLAWSVFEPNDTLLAKTVESVVATLMEQVWEAGGLAGAGAQDSYLLRVEPGPARIGQLELVLGVALSRPAEFLTLRVSRTDNRLDIAELPEPVRAEKI